jgi:hypothetical protein
MVIIKQLLPLGIERCICFGINNFIPAGHEINPLLGNFFFLLCCVAIGISPYMLHFCLHILVDMPDA